MGKAAFCAVLCMLLVCFAGCGGGGGESGSSAVANGTASGDGAVSGDTESNGGTANGGTALLNLAWDSPVDVDGNPLADIAGFRVYYGTEPGVYTSSIDVGPRTTYSFSLPSGAYYFAVTDYDSSGNESGYSNEVSRNIL